MGTSCIGKPRQGANLMITKDTPEKRYSKKGSKEGGQMEKGVAGQSEGNRLKINRSLLGCSICMQNYNTRERQPVMVCSNNHTFCRQCVSQIEKQSGKCPQCRQMFSKKIRNRDIFQVIEDNMKLLEEDKVEEVEFEGEERMEFTINTNNPLIDSFWVQGRRVMKVRNDRVWEGFVSEELISKQKQSTFAVKVVASKYNNIEIGIVGQGYKMEKNRTCKEAVVYHLADGMVLSGVKGKESSEWKQRGQPITEKNLIVIEVKVDGRGGNVSWWLRDNQIASATFSGYLLKNSMVGYVMMCHQNDIVQLNP